MSTYDLKIDDLFDEVDLLHKYIDLNLYICNNVTTLDPLVYQQLKNQKKMMSDLVYRLAMNELVELQDSGQTSDQINNLELASKTIKDAIKLEQDVVKYSGIVVDVFLQVLKIGSGGFTVPAVLNILNGVITQNGWG